jgi:hypothetical protein
MRSGIKHFNGKKQHSFCCVWQHQEIEIGHRLATSGGVGETKMFQSRQEYPNNRKKGRWLLLKILSP